MKTKYRIGDPDILAVGNALMRAAQRARRVAAMTRTPLVVFEKGRITEKRVRR